MTGILVGRGTADLFSEAFYAVLRAVVKALIWVWRKVVPSDVR